MDYLQDAIQQQGRLSAEQTWNLIETSSYADLHLTYVSALIEQAAELSEDAQGANKTLQQWNG